MSAETIKMNAEVDYPFVKDCFAQEKQIAKLKLDINYWRLRFNKDRANEREALLKVREEIYSVMGCPAIIEAKRQADTKNIFDKYAGTAKTRIETESIQMKYVYIGFSALALGIASFIIIRKFK